MRKFAPFLKLYSEYVKNFDIAMETITYWLDKSPRLLQIVKEIQVSVKLLYMQHICFSHSLLGYQTDNSHVT